MKKIFTGLSMAWGNFLALPCPIKKWDKDLNSYMLAFLPLVGLVIGALWSGACILLVWLGMPFLVLAFMLTFLLYALSGFMHLDGFMDCCDAIMSSRALDERQRILKDTHCGAFAVVSVVFMLLGAYSCVATALSGGLDFVDLCLIPIISRSVAGANVLLRKPLDHSQYAVGQADSPESGDKASEVKSMKTKALILLAVQAVLFIAVGLFFATYIPPTSLVIGATAVATYLATVYAKRKLGGMSGDIAGFAIVWGELVGIFSMLVL